MCWVEYQNGNYTVKLNLENGTKIRSTEESEFIPDRVESMDVKITNQCQHNCGFCHEGSVPDGNKATLVDIYDFAKSLPPHTEIALGGGNLMEDPWHTEEALKIFKTAGAVCSITVRQDDFVKDYGWIAEWKKLSLVYGIGISLVNVNDPSFWALYDMTPTAVIHTIAGILTQKDMGVLAEHRAKVLVLGYKQLRRGETYFIDNEERIQKNIEFLSRYAYSWSRYLEVLSFDNLALEQLDIRNKVPEYVWEHYYMGDDGTTTFFVDLVEKEYARSSTHPVRHKMLDKTIPQMYKSIVYEREVDSAY